MTDQEYIKQKEILIKAWKADMKLPTEGRTFSTEELFKRLEELYEARVSDIDIVEYQSQLIQETI